jgi:hypothetical protein
VNIRLRESEDKAEIRELFFDTEEAKVIGVDKEKLVGSIFQREGEYLNLRSFDVLGGIGTGTFNAHPRLFSRNDFGRIFNTVQNAVPNLLNDIIDSNASAGTPEAMTSMIAGSRGKQSAVGSEDIEADKVRVVQRWKPGNERFPVN